MRYNLSTLQKNFQFVHKIDMGSSRAPRWRHRIEIYRVNSNAIYSHGPWANYHQPAQLDSPLGRFLVFGDYYHGDVTTNVIFRLQSLPTRMEVHND